MIGLSDRQLAIVMAAAAPLSADKRSLFLQRVDAMLRYRRADRGFHDDDVIDVAAFARVGLMQNTDTAA